MKTIKKIIMIILILAILVCIGAITFGYVQKFNYHVDNPVATIEIENFGTIKLELYPDKAPNTVSNFIALANNGFYNGLTFHRTIPDFMIQGGDPNGDGSGSPTLSAINPNIEKGSEADKEYNIKGEFIANGVKTNDLKFEKGVLAMARSDYGDASIQDKSYNSEGSQFFIMTEDTSNLNGLYTGFGKVIEGQEVVDSIANVEVHYREDELAEGEEAPKDDEGNTISSDTPKEKPIIKSISVETYGVDYGMPETEDTFDYNSWILQKYYSNYGG